MRGDWLGVWFSGRFLRLSHKLIGGTWSSWLSVVPLAAQVAPQEVPGLLVQPVERHRAAAGSGAAAALPGLSGESRLAPVAA